MVTLLASMGIMLCLINQRILKANALVYPGMYIMRAEFFRSP